MKSHDPKLAAIGSACDPLDDAGACDAHFHNPLHLHRCTTDFSVDPVMISIRPAVETDIEALYSLDLIAREESQRREFIRREVVAGNCFVAVVNETVVGYGVLNYTFYYSGCIEMIYVDSEHRRCGAGAALLRHMELLCKTPKLFTSTNLSNLPMQSLLAKQGYALSGVIHNLDDGDPEIVYFKRLR